MVCNLSSSDAHSLVNKLKERNVSASVSEHRTNSLVHIQVNVYDSWHGQPFSIGSIPPRSHAIASRLKEIMGREAVVPTEAIA